MKKLIFIAVLFILGMVAYAQSMWKPVPPDLISKKALGKSTAFIPRFTLGITAQQFSWNKEESKLDQSTLSKIGIGVAAAHYINLNDGTLYNNFTITGLCLFPTVEDSGVTLAAVASALKFANISPGIGVGYDFGIKRVLGLFNAVLTF